jgi:hypothetical protein
LSPLTTTRRAPATCETRALQRPWDAYGSQAFSLGFHGGVQRHIRPAPNEGGQHGRHDPTRLSSSKGPATSTLSCTTRTAAATASAPPRARVRLVRVRGANQRQAVARRAGPPPEPLSERVLAWLHARRTQQRAKTLALLRASRARRRAGPVHSPRATTVAMNREASARELTTAFDLTYTVHRMEEEGAKPQTAHSAGGRGMLCEPNKQADHDRRERARLVASARSVSGKRFATCRYVRPLAWVQRALPAPSRPARLQQPLARALELNKDVAKHTAQHGRGEAHRPATRARVALSGGPTMLARSDMLCGSIPSLRTQASRTGGHPVSSRRQRMGVCSPFAINILVSCFHRPRR